MAVFTPDQLPTEYPRYADPEIICHGKIVGDCLKGDLSSDREVLDLGDSLAATLNYFFDYLGKLLGFKARIITASSCVTVPGFDYQRIPKWAQKPCLDKILSAQGQVQTTETVIIGMWSYHTQSINFTVALQNDLQNVGRQNKQDVILSQVPSFK